MRDLQAAVRAIGQQLRVVNASIEPEINAAFAALVNQRDTALLVTNDPLFTGRRDQVVALAAQYAVPTIYDRRAYAAAGGLMSYGTDYLDGYRKLGIYASKILNGAKPADLPVEQSTKFELVIKPEINAAFAALVNQRDTALLVTNDPLFTGRRDQVVALAAQYAVPTIYDRRAYAAAGGLMSYGTDYLDGSLGLDVPPSLLVRADKVIE